MFLPAKKAKSSHEIWLKSFLINLLRQMSQSAYTSPHSFLVY